MNFSLLPDELLTWHLVGALWCAACFLIGIWVGWLLWRHTNREVTQLEMENRKAQQDFEKREKAFTSNQEVIDSTGELRT